MKKNRITKLKIDKLFGYQDISIDFESRVKILIGENGLGKTTVLNMLYFLLDKKFDKLDDIKFERIELVFSNKRKISFTHNSLSYFLEKPKRYQSGQFYQILSKQLSQKDVNNLKNIIDDKKIHPIERDKIIAAKINELGVKINAPSRYIYENIKKLISEFEAIEFQKIIEQIDSEVQSKILYFPTFRRIESQFSNLSSNSREALLEEYPFLDESDLSKLYNADIIQFGMQDVEARISNITSEITQKSLVGFSNITGDLLGQLSQNFPISIVRKRKDDDKLKIILERVGSRISFDDKENIINYVKSGDVTNKGLLYLIDKLIDLYDEQESLDKAIKDFRDTCNLYLNRKAFVYDESQVSLKILRENSSESVELDYLSSGEKQIVSLFSKIYLEKEENYIVLFDEPELSLSIFWQQRLLPDIMSSQQCNFLLAVTHSPFIYDNNLEEYAFGLDQYFVKN
ncbi:AAA family ATPase [Labilibaculum euxinus]|uniref:AAA family ATPase n=1 Tax=Labilibaculum euxinus TaxID=2686357 RepID=A0A7M4DB43_9BACT|nr:AAA family ATPase [Labilibaculum euxinus]MUP39872.1 AAA family ATPase [Labilibaculum euxinus]MVB09077.1 AAA family ATPase [Labilibaculum euxinus]